MSPRRLPSTLSVLYDPDGFFADRRNASLLRALGVVTVVALVTTAGVALIGRWMATAIDATHTVTIMEPWSNETCASFASMNETGNTSQTPTACGIDEPRTREVDIGEEVWEAMVARLPFVFVAPFLVWIVVAIGLHLLSSIVGGEGSFLGTLVVAAWGMLPSILGGLIGLASAYVALQGMEFANDPEVLQQQIRTLSETRQKPIELFANVAITLWQGYIWAFGLKHARDLDIGTATIAAGIATLIALLLELV